MFLPFSITTNEIIKLTDFFNIKQSQHYTTGKTPKDLLFDSIDFNTGVVDADKLKNGWLPIGSHYDVFISYSHNDERIAIQFAAWLENKGLKVFLDSYYWNSSDELLKEIDKKYCLQSDGYYAYKKRNYSTSVVHAILSMAILNAIDKSDVAFFVGSENSLALNLDPDGVTTKSPWLFEELNYITSINKRIPEWAKLPKVKHFCVGGAVEVLDESRELKVKFSIPTNKIIQTNSRELNSLSGKDKNWLHDLYITVDNVYRKYLST